MCFTCEFLSLFLDDFKVTRPAAVLAHIEYVSLVEYVIIMYVCV